MQRVVSARPCCFFFRHTHGRVSLRWWRIELTQESCPDGRVSTTKCPTQERWCCMYCALVYAMYLLSIYRGDVLWINQCCASYLPESLWIGFRKRGGLKIKYNPILFEEQEVRRISFNSNKIGIFHRIVQCSTVLSIVLLSGHAWTVQSILLPSLYIVSCLSLPVQVSLRLTTAHRTMPAITSAHRNLVLYCIAHQYHITTKHYNKLCPFLLHCSTSMQPLMIPPAEKTSRKGCSEVHYKRRKKL